MSDNTSIMQAASAQSLSLREKLRADLAQRASEGAASRWDHSGSVSEEVFQKAASEFRK